MIHLLKNIIFITLLLACLFANAQEGPPLLRKLTAENGLPQGFISAIVQDSKGFIWIGTRNGLARYDGREFRNFYHIPSVKGGLSSGIITQLWLDKKDKLWITYESGHLDIFNTATEKIIPLTAKKEFAGLEGLFKRGRSFIDTSGDYWLLANTGEVYIINEAFTTLQHIRQKDPVLGIASVGKSIILTTDYELIFLDKNHAVTQRVTIPFKPTKLPPSTVGLRDNSVIARPNGQLTIVYDDKIINYRPSDKTFKSIPLPSTLNKQYLAVSQKVIGNDGSIYFSKNWVGMLSLDPQNNLKVVSTKMNGSPQLIDRSGILWVGTGGLGIEQYDLRINHLARKSINKLFHTNILKKAGLDDRRANKLLDTISGYYWRWLQAKDGTLWVAQSQPDSHIGSVFSMDRDKKVNYPQWKYEGGLPKKLPTCAMAEDPSGRVWGIGLDMRLYTLDPATNTITFRHKVPFDIGDPFQNEINGLVAGNSDFWISSTLGLFHYDIGNGKTTRYFPDVRVISILRDSKKKDILWIGTMYAGLIKFNTKTRQHFGYTTANGLPHNTVANLLSDSSGNLWGITGKGLLSFAFDGSRIHLHNVIGENGQEFNRYHYFKFPDGRLAFGGAYGYVVFDPKSMLTDNYKPETLITSIFINNRELPAVNQFSGNGINGIQLMELPYDKNSLAFEFAAAEYNLPEKIQYRYQMKGLDDGWVFSGNDNTATYSYIPPGDYELHINASNTMGEWSDKVKIVKIHISPPFWLTWWFMSAIILIVALLVYLGVRRKITQTRKKDMLQMAYEREAMQLEAKAMRAQMNPHFIFNCLNSIKSLMHDFRNKEAILYLSTFAQLLRNQLNSNLLEVSLADELHTCRLYLKLEALRFGKKLQYEFDIDPDVDPNAIKIPALLLQPFIENAIIHGLLPLPQGGKITVSVILEDELIYCKIDDNGAGRNSQPKEPGHESKGVKLVEGRLDLYNAMHNGSASIEIIDKKDSDGQPSGTLVIITLNV
ncbi:ligand-binding sensor domain-containing protein [Flavobacterium sp.]|uniref:ligand-binding sensor domain-containing protein n=2 Tax=Flavobacterium sp. TaxID=239 RepID=UPI0040342BF3